MIKAFLSHSSNDKGAIVEPVANWLGKDNVIYDKFTFEEGEKTLDEILRGLDQTDLFVLFISESALNSDWVKREITEMRIKLDEEKITKFYPLIIDESIQFSDKRIPQWMKEQYNLKHIKRAKVIATRIRNKLRELSWARHPKLLDRHKLFAGRNSELESFEMRMHDFDREKPQTIFVSGFSGIGRRTFLLHGLFKTHCINFLHKPSTIYLDRNVSIEDFILKLNDLGYIELDDAILSLSDKTIEDKIAIIHSIMSAAYSFREIIFIVDDGCLINYKRSVAPWFVQLIDSYKGAEFPIFCCASKYNVPFGNRPKNDSYYFIELNELNSNERKNLLSQIITMEDVAISKSDFNAIAYLLTGFPDQAHFAVDIIREGSLESLSDRLYRISQFSMDKAAVILQKHENNSDLMEFVRLLAQFEIITKDFVFSIVPEKIYFPILEVLVSENICELIGIGGEMIRLNDIVRDYIKRNRLSLKKEFDDTIKKLVSEMISKEDLFEQDSSEYIFSIKEALKNDQPINDSLLIPSHYLRCMKDLYYNHGHLDRIIELADLILQKEKTLEPSVVQDIRYYLCLALAKKQNSRLLKEVQYIQGEEHTFLLGYYYRKSGRLNDALEQYLKIVNAPYVDARAKRELVQVYFQLDEYDKALEYAAKNYRENIGNQFHTQAYFNCLINSKYATQDKSLLRELIENLYKIDSDQSVEMAEIAEALFQARIEHNFNVAKDLIDDAIAKYHGNQYPLMSKCEIAVMFKDQAMLLQAISMLETIPKREVSKRTIAKYKAYLAALQGNEAKALEIIQTTTSKYPSESKEKIIAKIHDLLKT